VLIFGRGKFQTILDVVQVVRDGATHEFMIKVGNFFSGITPNISDKLL